MIPSYLVLPAAICFCMFVSSYNNCGRDVARERVEMEACFRNAGSYGLLRLDGPSVVLNSQPPLVLPLDSIFLRVETPSPLGGGSLSFRQPHWFIKDHFLKSRNLPFRWLSWSIQALTPKAREAGGQMPLARDGLENTCCLCPGARPCSPLPWGLRPAFF